MRGKGWIVVALLWLGAIVEAACVPAGGRSGGPIDPEVRGALERLAQRRVFFAHQSVGRDVLGGLGRLAAAGGVPLQIMELDGAAEVPPRTFAHSAVAFNSRPDVKLQGFAGALDGARGSAPEIAILKFCFVDVRADTDVAWLFGLYRRTLAALKDRHPGTTFVHVTVPLKARATGPKAWLGRLRGQRPIGHAENARRAAYNRLLREAYVGREPVFDLAELESTWPDGRPELDEWRGEAVPALVPAYTTDGGHLDVRGSERAARALAALLASLPASAGRMPPGGVAR